MIGCENSCTHICVWLLRLMIFLFFIFRFYLFFNVFCGLKSCQCLRLFACLFVKKKQITRNIRARDNVTWQMPRLGCCARHRGHHLPTPCFEAEGANKDITSLDITTIMRQNKAVPFFLDHSPQKCILQAPHVPSPTVPIIV